MLRGLGNEITGWRAERSRRPWMYFFRYERDAAPLPAVDGALPGHALAAAHLRGALPAAGRAAARAAGAAAVRGDRDPQGAGGRCQPRPRAARGWLRGRRPRGHAAP